MNTSIFPVSCHTDHIGPGSTFVVIQGLTENGVKYIPLAIVKGATRIVIQHNTMIADEIAAHIKEKQVELVHVENSRKALALLSAQAVGYPAQTLKIIGITGTKGKTSTSFLVEHILKYAGYKTALLGTVKNSIAGVDVPATLTTPQPDYLHMFLRQCVEYNVEYVVMEVAAQAFSLHRIEGIFFDVALMTNFSQEHGEFYATQEDYFAAKTQILEHLKPHAPLLVNADDVWCQKLLDLEHVKGFNLGSNDPDSLIAQCNVSWKNIDYIFSCPALIGSFNRYNLLASCLIALELDIEPSIIQESLQSFAGVPGRVEQYKLPNGALGVIDYAHNPSSFSAVLSTLRALTDHLIVVFGCGGDRDASKRPVMGAIAAELADLIVITSDNPRSENPADIADAIFGGIKESDQKKVLRELDREKAIKLAYAHAKPGGIVALLGKGPDEYQQIGQIKYRFSEKSILRGL